MGTTIRVYRVAVAIDQHTAKTTKGLAGLDGENTLSSHERLEKDFEVDLTYPEYPWADDYKTTPDEVRAYDRVVDEFYKAINERTKEAL